MRGSVVGRVTTQKASKEGENTDTQTDIKKMSIVNEGKNNDKEELCAVNKKSQSVFR